MGLTRNYFGLPSGDLTGSVNQGVSTNIPVVDTKANADGIAISLVVSGVNDDDIAVVAKNGQLVVELEKEYNPFKVAHTNWDKRYGIFTRYFDLPSDVDTSSLKKSINEGVLTIEMVRSGATKTGKSAPQKSGTTPEMTV